MSLALFPMCLVNLTYTRVFLVVNLYSNFEIVYFSDVLFCHCGFFCLFFPFFVWLYCFFSVPFFPRRTFICSFGCSYLCSLIPLHLETLSVCECCSLSCHNTPIALVSCHNTPIALVSCHNTPIALSLCKKLNALSFVAWLLVVLHLCLLLPSFIFCLFSSR